MLVPFMFPPLCLPKYFLFHDTDYPSKTCTSLITYPDIQCLYNMITNNCKTDSLVLHRAIVPTLTSLAMALLFFISCATFLNSGYISITRQDMVPLLSSQEKVVLPHSEIRWVDKIS